MKLIAWYNGDALNSALPEKLIAWYNGDALNSALPERDASVKYLKTYEIKRY